MTNQIHNRGIKFFEVLAFFVSTLVIVVTAWVNINVNIARMEEKINALERTNSDFKELMIEVRTELKEIRIENQRIQIKIAQLENK